MMGARMHAAMGAPARPTLGPVLQRECACGSHAAGGECESCKEKRGAGGGVLQRQNMNTTPSAAPPIVHDVLRLSGQRLDAETRAFTEPRFGHDLCQVRVHADAKAAESVRSVNALAFTVGNQLNFPTGRYQPQMIAGNRFLAHDLTHVVQQRATQTLRHFGNVPGCTGPSLQRHLGRSDAQDRNKQKQTVDQSGTTTASTAGGPSLSAIPLEGLTEGHQDPSMTEMVTGMKSNAETKKREQVIDSATGEPKRISVSAGAREVVKGRPDVPTVAKGVEQVALSAHSGGGISKIPLFPPDRPNGRRIGPPPTAPLLLRMLQPKLVVGAVDDTLEHEADHVADQVMRMPDRQPSRSAAPRPVSRKLGSSEKEEVQTLQAKTLATSTD